MKRVLSVVGIAVALLGCQQAERVLGDSPACRSDADCADTYRCDGRRCVVGPRKGGGPSSSAPGSGAGSSSSAMASSSASGPEASSSSAPPSSSASSDMGGSSSSVTGASSSEMGSSSSCVPLTECPAGACGYLNAGCGPGIVFCSQEACTGAEACGGGGDEIRCGATLQTFSRTYPQADVARMVPRLVLPVRDATQFVVGRALYIAGGEQGGETTVPTVQRALLQADGTLSGFETFTRSLVTSRASASAVVVGNRVYVMGGRTMANQMSAALDTIEVASIDSITGAPGDFTELSTTRLPAASQGHTMFAAGSALYVLGGTDGNADHGVRYSILDGAGNPQAFNPINDPGFTPRAAHASLFMGGHVYVMGGVVAGESTAAVLSAPVNGSALQAFSSVEALPGPLWNSVALPLGGRFYLLGGRYTEANMTEQPTAAVFSAAPTGSGNTTGFIRETGTALTGPRLGHSVVQHGFSVHVVGGHDGASAPTDTAEWASTLVTTKLGAFDIAVAPTGLVPRTGHTTAVIGNFLYVLGGVTSEGMPAPTQRAFINGDGSLGMTFEVAEPSVRPGACIAIMGNAIVMSGGIENGSASTRIEMVTVTPQGVVMGAAGLIASMQVGRAYHACIVVDQRFYVLGGGTGPDGGSLTASIEAFDRNLAGMLIEATGQPPLPEARRKHRALVLRERLYIVGGETQLDTPTGSMTHAPVAGGTLGAFATPAIDLLPTPRSQFSMVALGGEVAFLGGNGLGGAVTTVDKGWLDGSAQNVLPQDFPELRAVGLVGSVAVVVGHSVLTVSGHFDADSQVTRAVIQ